MNDGLDLESVQPSPEPPAEELEPPAEEPEPPTEPEPPPAEPEPPPAEPEPSSEELTDSEKRGPFQRIGTFVAVLCALSFVEGICVNGLPNINITSLEKRYGLTSKEAGFITSSGELGAISTVLFVSFYGGRSHRPRVAAGGGFLMAIGSLLFLMPHVLFGSYDAFGTSDSETVKTCLSQQSTCEKIAVQGYMPLFIAGRVLTGIGFTPVFTCGFAYIDDHASTESTAVYIGLTYAITALGAGAGYAFGGQLLTLWVDIGRTDTSKITIEKTDKRWVGAWWIGYVSGTILFCIVSTILCFFPRFMKSSKARSKELAALEGRTSAEPVRRRASEGPAPQVSLWQLILSFPKALLDLARNPLYVLLVSAGIGDSLLVSGIAGFAPKIIQEKYHVQPKEAGLIMGSVALLGGAGGMALGGYLIRKFHLHMTGIIKMNAILIALAGAAGGIAFFINCPSPLFAGVNSYYGSAKQTDLDKVDLRATCNEDCTCNRMNFDPVCGDDEITYFSACYAGCYKAENKSDLQKRRYSNCSCVIETLNKNQKSGNGTAISGGCSEACFRVWPFVVFFFFGIFFTFLTVTPLSMSILRCVPVEERSVGLGLQWVGLRLLGTIPGPIMTGSVLDRTCLLWQETCSGHGSCWQYDDWKLSLRLFLLWICFKTAAFSFLLLAFIVYKKKGHAEIDRQEREIFLSKSMEIPHESVCLSICKSDGGNISPKLKLPEAPVESPVDTPRPSATDVAVGGASAVDAGHVKALAIRSGNAVTIGSASAIAIGSAKAITIDGASGITIGGAEAVTIHEANAITIGGNSAVDIGGASAVDTGRVSAFATGRVSALAIDSASAKPANLEGVTKSSSLHVPSENPKLPTALRKR